MNEVNVSAQSKEKMSVEHLGVIEILIVLARRKRLIIGSSISMLLISVCGSFLIPKTYVSETKLLPPQQSQSTAAALLSQIGGIASMGGGIGGLKNPNDLYVGMLKSRTLADRLIDRFGLQKRYGTPSRERARALLSENTMINVGKDNLIAIDVEDQDKKLVAPLANAYVEELIRLTSTLAVTEASQRRLFFERQLELSKNNLAAAETALKNALDTRGVISVDSDSRAILETVGRVRAQVSAKEIQLSSMKAFVTPNNPDYRRVEEELNSLRLELANLENGRGADEKNGERSSNGGLENIKLLRNVKYYQMLYELLAKQYEAARLDEAKDNSVIQVLDPAIEPERHAKPRRAVIVIVSTLLAFLASIFYALMSETKRLALSAPGASEKWNEFKQALTNKKSA
jgi:tyrosine-protein kinase Etk/Wzc